MGVKRALLFKDTEDKVKELPHGSGDNGFFGKAARGQALTKGTNNGIVLFGDNGREIQCLTESNIASLD